MQEIPSETGNIFHWLNFCLTAANSILLIRLVFAAGQYKQKLDQVWKWYQNISERRMMERGINGNSRE